MTLRARHWLLLGALPTLACIVLRRVLAFTSTEADNDEGRCVSQSRSCAKDAATLKVRHSAGIRASVFSRAVFIQVRSVSRKVSWLPLSSEKEVDNATAFSNMRDLVARGINKTKEEEEEEAQIPHPFWVFDWDTDVMKALSNVSLCSAVLLLSGALCAMAGIGGNIIQVTVLMAAGDLSPHDAVPLSKAIILAGSVGSLAVHLSAPRWKAAAGIAPTATLISWTSCSLAVPAALCGTIIGVMLNAKVPDVALLSLLSGVLLCLAVWVGRQACLLHSAERLRPRTASDEVRRQDSGLPQNEHPSRAGIAVMLLLLLFVVSGGILHELTEQCHDAAYAWWKRDPHRHCEHPVLKIAFWGKVEAFTMDEYSNLIIQRLSILLPALVCLVSGEMATVKAADLMSWMQIRMIQLLLFSVGVLGSLTGFGGGIVLSPFFVMLGLTPISSVATSTVCIIFISASSALQYVITNRVKMALALIYSLVNVAASCFGTFSMHMLADRSARTSPVMAIICLSVVVSFMISFTRLLELLSATVGAG